MGMARVRIKTSIAMLALLLVAGCSRILDRDRDDDHHSDEGKTTTTTTVHED